MLSSGSGRLVVGQVSHAPAVAAPRVYTARRGDELVLFDGFPLEREGRFPAHDATVLLERWDEAPHRLEGIFSAVRADLGNDHVECVLDLLGMAPVFVHRAPDRTVVANSVAVIRSLCHLSAPDPLGVSSLVALGWPADGRTLLRGVEFLEPGGVHRFSPTDTRFAPMFAPVTVLRTQPPPAATLPERVLSPVRTAVTTGAALTSALSSGRDTRALLALLGALGAQGRAVFFTSGVPGALDVTIAQRLAERFGLHHRTMLQALPESPAALMRRTAEFVARGDGLASLEGISDHLDHDVAPDRLALELWGVGGEIGRKVKWVASSVGGLTPGLRRSFEVQRRLLGRGARAGSPLLRIEGRAEVARFLDAFVAARRAEGWAAEDIIDAYYAFARVRHWAARGVRRAAASADLFSPFVTRAFIEHCLSVTPGTRYVELPHRRIITTLWPAVDAERYEFAWRPPYPRLAFGLLVAEYARRLVRRRVGRPIEGVHPKPFSARWFEAGLEAHRPLADLDSPVWEFVDRDRYRELLAGPSEAREPYLPALSRILTALVWFALPDGLPPAAGEDTRVSGISHFNGQGP